MTLETLLSSGVEWLLIGGGLLGLLQFIRSRRKDKADADTGVIGASQGAVDVISDVLTETKAMLTEERTQHEATRELLRIERKERAEERKEHAAERESWTNERASLVRDLTDVTRQLLEARATSLVNAEQLSNLQDRLRTVYARYGIPPEEGLDD